jgi:hypothetical protein
MKDMFNTLQSSNFDIAAADFNYLMDLCQCPYSFSLSFLEDPSLIGKKDDLGQLKYKLNLDE